MTEPCATRLEMGRAGLSDVAMNLEERKRIVGRQALILTIASLVSFVLPKIFHSMTDGRSQFLIDFGQMFPLLLAVTLSGAVLSNSLKSVGGGDQASDSA